MSGIGRVTTFAQQQQTLLNLLRNEQSLNDVLLQQSTGLKTQTFSGVASQAGQLLNVNALSSQAQGFLNNISAATTRLNLTDTTLASIGSLASNFQQELQQLQSSPTPPNIADLARTTLNQLGSLLDSSDGTQYLFAGGQQNAPPVTSLNLTRIPTTTLSLSGNLDTQGVAPVNGNVAPPDAGSYVDVGLTGQNAVFDDQGHQYDTTVRFVHQSANQWQAYLVGMVRSDDNSISATANGKPISATNPVALGTPFDPSVAPGFDQVNQVVPSDPLSFDNLGTVGVPQIGLPGGGHITVNVDANQITNTGAASSFSQIDNATTTSRVVLNQLNLDPTSPLGDTVSVSLSGTNALFANGAQAGSDKLNATVTLTKIQLADPSQVPPVPEVWQAKITSLTDAATGAPVAQAIGGPNAGLPISPTNPYVIGTFQSGQVALGSLNIGAPASGTTDATGQVFEMSAATSGALDPVDNGITLRAGVVTTNTTGSSVGLVTVNPVPPPGTPQILELSGNLSSATPVNISVATPTPGSFADISFNNAQALVDSNGDAHNLTIRIIKTQTGPDLYQAYAIGLTDVESGNDSSNPPISLTNPVALGPAFDPSSAASLAASLPTGQLTFSPNLANGATMSVNIPITASTFSTANSTIVLSDADNTTASTSSTPNGRLNVVGNLSSAAVGIPSAATVAALASSNIVKGGSGYLVGDTITFNTPAGGTAATATVTSIDANGGITGVTVATAGSNYTLPPSYSSSSGSTSGAGTGAVVNANLDGPAASDLTNAIGALSQPAGTAIVPTAGGAGYNAATTIVTFPPPPNGGVTATGTATVVAGVVTQITITDAGSGYTTPLTPIITDTTGAGSGATAAAISIVPENPNNTADLQFFGPTALRDSTGKAYDATVRLQYSTVGTATGWRATLTSLIDPATGQPASGLVTPIAIGTPPFDVFNAKDAALGAITIPSNGPQVVNIPGTGTSLSLSLPFNSENFSATGAATNLAVGGVATTSLSANIADTTYFQPGNSVFNTSQSQLTFRTAADSVVQLGIRADNPAFEQLFRVLNFFKDQSVPSNPNEVSNASQLLNTAIKGINVLRADVANTQAVLTSETNYHQTTINLASATKDSIITADSATTAMNLNAIANLLQESFATIGVIKSLSLVNYLK